MEGRVTHLCSSAVAELPRLPPAAAGPRGNFPGSRGLDVGMVPWVWVLFVVFDDNFSQGRFC